MIDSSPMYGSSQAVIGYGLAKLGKPLRVFSADKVWISSGQVAGAIQESASSGRPRFDLVAVHNLLHGRTTCPRCSQ
jgi:diketogulonate reductase-like aldo/keto reductase